MLIKDTITVNGKEFVRHQSDSNKYIRQVETDNLYTLAVDVIPCRYIYEETDKDIPKREG